MDKKKLTQKESEEILSLIELARKVNAFDCDSSDYAMERYLSKYEWIKGYRIIITF